MDRRGLGGRCSNRCADAGDRQDKSECDQVLGVTGLSAECSCAHFDSDVGVDVDTKTFVERHYEQTSDGRKRLRGSM